jgi:hypothetical protein
VIGTSFRVGETLGWLVIALYAIASSLSGGAHGGA